MEEVNYNDGRYLHLYEQCEKDSVDIDSDDFNLSEIADDMEMSKRNPFANQNQNRSSMMGSQPKRPSKTSAILSKFHRIPGGRHMSIHQHITGRNSLNKPREQDIDQGVHRVDMKDQFQENGVNWASKNDEIEQAIDYEETNQKSSNPNTNKYFQFMTNVNGGEKDISRISEKNSNEEASENSSSSDSKVENEPS